jgi:16S rRNA (adenine1518-N6/adenine1519-N6)-dimethyltransferase
VPYAHPTVQVDDEVVFEQLVRQAFSQRRKTLRNALRGTLEAEAISALGIDPSARAETLAISEFAVLANSVRPADTD